MSSISTIPCKTWKSSFCENFFALHGMPARTSDEKGVCMSVRLSVKRVDCDKREERSVQIFVPYGRSFSLVFREKESLIGGNLFYLNFGSNWPRWSEIADCQSIFPCSATVAPSKKIQLTLTGSPLRTFQWA